MTKRFLPNVDDCFITESATIRDALQAISRSGALMACIVRPDKTLVGIITDSDIRRGLLQGRTLDSEAKSCGRFSPITAPLTASSIELKEMASQYAIRDIPLIDDNGRVGDIFVSMIRQERIDFEKQFNQSKPILENTMLILAGGKGTRLRAVVSDRPKPLALVGGKPILQTLIEHARQSGVQKFLISVNYLADQIIAHLKRPEYNGLEIQSVREKEFLGTAGCLGLISEQFPQHWQKPLLIANGDVLTNVPFDSVIAHHLTSGSDITCVVRPFHLTIPFGVVEIQQERITEIREKPTLEHIVNAGIYVISPKIKEFIKSGEVLDMPTLLGRAIQAGCKVTPFFMHEYWLDVGKPEDFAKANEEFMDIFGS